MFKGLMYMFHSLRLKNWKLTLISILCFLVILTVCLLMLRAAPIETVESGGEKLGLKIASDEDVEAFLIKCGHTVEGCVSDEEITVPKNWNDTYSAYNDLQQQQGFDLRPYKGEPARRLVYALADGEQYAAVLISADRIIAADISSMQPGSDPQPLIQAPAGKGS